MEVTSDRDSDGEKSDSGSDSNRKGEEEGEKGGEVGRVGVGFTWHHSAQLNMKPFQCS